MLPPGTVLLNEKSFFYYDHHISNTNKTMKEGHYHNYYEMYFLFSDSCEYLINDKIYTLRPNSFVFIPNNTIHKTIYNSCRYERIVLNFSSDYIDPILQDSLSNVFFCTLEKKEEIEYIRNNLLYIKKNCYANNSLSQLLLRCHLTEILIYTVTNHIIDPGKNIIELAPVNQALTYIAEHYSQNITLKQLADTAGYNADYFSKLFKKIIGTGYKEYLLLTRLNAAENFLTTTSKSIREIAISCGFNDSNHFSTTFKKKYGFSPREYKIQKNTELYDN